MEYYIGQIMAVAFNFAPKGWALCNGQLLPINQNQALYSLLGTTYGGDGKTQFALPDLRGRVITGAWPRPGQRGGAEAVALTASQMPTHAHAFPASGAVAPIPGRGTTALPAQGNQFGTAGGSGKIYDTPTAMVALAGNVQNAGGSMPHNNMQPFLVLNFIIALQGGLYPPRSE